MSCGVDLRVVRAHTSVRFRALPGVRGWFARGCFGGNIYSILYQSVVSTVLLVDISRGKAEIRSVGGGIWQGVMGQHGAGCQCTAFGRVSWDSMGQGVMGQHGTGCHGAGWHGTAWGRVSWDSIEQGMGQRMVAWDSAWGSRRKSRRGSTWCEAGTARGVKLGQHVVSSWDSMG